MTKISIAALAVGLLAAACAHAQPAVAPAFSLTREQVAALVARTQDGLAAANLPTGERGPVTVIARREKSGDVELHDAMNDILMGQAGSAAVIVGGTAAGQRLTTPGEWRGGTIVGGTTYRLNPGDLIWIPAGQPHQVIVPAGAEVTYLAFKSPR
jgi:hypothetical protein